MKWLALIALLAWWLRREESRYEPDCDDRVGSRIPRPHVSIGGPGR